MYWVYKVPQRELGKKISVCKMCLVYVIIFVKYVVKVNFDFWTNVPFAVNKMKNNFIVGEVVV